MNKFLYGPVSVLDEEGISVASGIILLVEDDAVLEPKNVEAWQAPEAESVMQAEVVEPQLPQIAFEEVAWLTPAAEAALVEIDDPQAIAQIDMVIPAVGQLAMDAAASGAYDVTVNGFNQTVRSMGKVYRAIIPSGATLANSTAMENAKRGIFHGPKGIRGHANLVEQQLKTADVHMADSLKMANAVNAAMNIASLVVGQYYMSQINNKMAALKDGVDKILQFQNAEYRSRVIALVAAVQRSSTFKYETMKSDELRRIELASLKNLEMECAQLLGQANLMIQECTGRDYKKDYAVYESLVGEIDSWFDYQQILLRVMDEIAELTYTLGLGSISRKNSYAMCDPYTAQSLQTQRDLRAWQQEVLPKVGVDLANSRRKKQSLAWKVPGLFNDDLNYTEITSEAKTKITRQIYGGTTEQYRDTTDYYNQDVCLIKQGGKTYYLPAAS